MKRILPLLLSLALLTACQSAGGVGDVTTAPPVSVSPTPMDDGSVQIAADTGLLAGILADPFEKEPYQNPSAPKTRRLRLELTTFELVYQDSCRGERIDGDLDRYVASEGELSVWYRAGSREIVSLELGTQQDFANDGEAALLVKAGNLLEDICDLKLDQMERTYTYLPKIEALQERLATVHYEIPRGDGRSWCYATVDFHVNMISIEIYNEPEPPAEVISALEAASARLADYLIHTRTEKDPTVTAVTEDALPDIYYKEGKWVLQTKRTVTYLLGKNEMTREVTFYLWQS